LLTHAPVLWIWDGVEHLTESAAGAAWNAQEQEEFANFLRAAHETQAKFLLVSRHEEKQWLHDLPVRFGIPPLPIRERLQLTRALMEQRGLRLKNVEDWHAVLEFSEGNPLAIRFLVEQALAENLRTRGEIDQFVARLRQSAPQSPQAGGTGLAEPMRVTLRYIQHNAFNEGERKILALLRLFLGRVSAELLAAMGGGGEKTWLPELQDIREFQELRAGAGPSVLDRAASVGLLHTEGENRYTTHPALQWFFQELFEECYPIAARPPKTAQRGSLALGAPPESKAPPSSVEVDFTRNREKSKSVKLFRASSEEARKLQTKRKQLLEERAQWVYFNRNLRVYRGHQTYLFKPLQRFHWTESVAMMDASDIIAETLGAGD
jgi:hypothetical protein